MRSASDVKSSESPVSDFGTALTLQQVAIGTSKNAVLRCFGTATKRCIGYGGLKRRIQVFPRKAKSIPTHLTPSLRAAFSSRKCGAPSHKRATIRSVDRNLQLPVKITKWKPEQIMVVFTQPSRQHFNLFRLLQARYTLQTLVY